MTDTNFTQTPPHWTRRQALGGLAATLGAGTGGWARADPAHARLHEDVAARVRDLTAGSLDSLRILVPDGAAGNLAPVIDAFYEMTGIKVIPTLSNVDEINARLTLETMGGLRNYDLALPATFGLPDLAAASALHPLDRLSQHHEPPGFRDGVLFAIGDSFDDKLYGFQADGDAYLMFYNRRMLTSPQEEARYADLYGTPLARPDTWRELDRQMAFFHRPQDGQYGGLMLRAPSYLAWEWWIRFHAKGVWPLSPEMEPQIASEAGISALEDMIHATEWLSPDARTVNSVNARERYAQGDIYCCLGWGGTQKYLNSPQSAMRGNLVYGPTPGDMIDGQLMTTPYFNWGWSYVVLAGTPRSELAYLFALFASTPEMSTRAVRQTDGFFDPLRPEHYADAGIQDAYTTEFLEVHRRSLETAIPDLYLKDQGDYFRVLGNGLHRAFTGEMTPAKALQRVAQRWQLITDGAGRDAQIRRWAELRAKYPLRTRQLLRNA